MAKSLLKSKPGTAEWRNHPGLISYIECNDSGKVSFRNGIENEELPMITNSFLQLGGMLGKSIGLKEIDEVLVGMEDRTAFFATIEGRHVGMELDAQ